MTATIAELRSTAEAASEAGITFRMADYWVRHGVITPAVAAEGGGTRRRWSTEDVFVLGVLGQVAEALGRDSCRISTEVLRQLAAAARETWRTSSGGRPTVYLTLPGRVGLVIRPKAGER